MFNWLWFVAETVIKTSVFNHVGPNLVRPAHFYTKWMLVFFDISVFEVFLLQVCKCGSPDHRTTNLTSLKRNEDMYWYVLPNREVIVIKIFSAQLDERLVPASSRPVSLTRVSWFLPESFTAETNYLIRSRTKLRSSSVKLLSFSQRSLDSPRRFAAALYFQPLIVSGVGVARPERLGSGSRESGAMINIRCRF